MEIARQLMADSRKATGLEQYAIAKYAEALEVRLPSSTRLWQQDAHKQSWCALACMRPSRRPDTLLLHQEADLYTGRQCCSSSRQAEHAHALLWTRQVANLQSCRQVVPRTIAETSGLPATETIARLHAAHAEGNRHAGLDILTGEARDLSQDAITDTYLTRW